MINKICKYLQSLFSKPEYKEKCENCYHYREWDYRTSSECFECKHNYKSKFERKEI